MTLNQVRAKLVGHPRTWLLLVIAGVSIWAGVFLRPGLQAHQATRHQHDDLARLVEARARLVGAQVAITRAHQKWFGQRGHRRKDGTDDTELLRLVTERTPSDIRLERMNPTQITITGQRYQGVDIQLTGPLESAIRYAYELEQADSPVLVSLINLRMEPETSPSDRTGRSRRVNRNARIISGHIQAVWREQP